MGLEADLKRATFPYVPMRCYLLCQLFAYSFRQADFLGTPLHTKARLETFSHHQAVAYTCWLHVATKLLKLVLYSLGTHSWISKGIQGSLEYLSHNDHAHWIVFCLLRPQESRWSKCQFCFKFPRGNISLYRPCSAIQILLPVSFQAKRKEHSCSERLEKFQKIFTVIAKGGATGLLEAPLLFSSSPIFPLILQLLSSVLLLSIFTVFTEWLNPA